MFSVNGDQTDDLAENRTKDKNIPSMPQEMHKAKQNSESLSNVPGCSPGGMNSYSRFDFVISLKAFFALPLNYPEPFHLSSSEESRQPLRHRGDGRVQQEEHGI